MELNDIIHDLKTMIIKECDKSELSIDDISDQEHIVGDETTIALDSMDILQLSVAIKNKYGIRIQRNAESRAAFENLSSLAQFIQRNQQ